jgi:hypothetical protein
VKIKCAFFSLFAFILLFSVATIEAQEPTWLFSVPKADSLGEDEFNIGFLYADFGVTENLEFGVHGVKYSLPDSEKFAFGLSFFPMASPYLVYSLGSDPGRLHIGVKAAPYIFFGAYETSISNSLKLVIEANNGIGAGLRIFPAKNWTLDVFAAFISFEVYKYDYRSLEIDKFRILPGIFFAYSGKL